jgi:hypothetical protein
MTSKSQSVYSKATRAAKKEKTAQRAQSTTKKDTKIVVKFKAGAELAGAV